MATRGLKPVAEIQFFDYIWPAMMQIRDELATLRWRSNGAFSCPLVIRVPIGGYLNGGAIYHSQCGEVTFTHIPGLRVVMPSNALDACGLLRTAIRCDDPVLFLEHKKLYREPYNRSPHPGPDFTIPFGKARRRESRAAISRSSPTARWCRSRCRRRCKSRSGIRQYVDRSDRSAHARALRLGGDPRLRWRRPAASSSRMKTTLSWGYGAEIAARIADELFDQLDAPVRRVGALDTWVGYHPQLEAAILPQVDDLAREFERLLAY